MGKLRLDDRNARALPAPDKGNRIDYDIAPDSGRGDFVRGFALRTTAAGTKTFLLVYVTAAGIERRHKIGDFGVHTVTTAREAARKMRTRVDAGHDPFAEQQDHRASEERRKAKATATLGRLLDAYVQKLRNAKKASADKVEAELHRTVRDAHPGLWKKPAAEVTLEELTRIPAGLARAGKIRQAEKTRSYLRAAYSAAAGARGNAQTQHLFEGFEHVTNLARDLTAIDRPAERSQANSKRELSAAELRAYWRRIKALADPHGAMLRFHLLTGAQRCEQLSRLTSRDYDKDAAVVTLWDFKGRRKTPRAHAVPLIPDAAAALEAMGGGGEKTPHLFTLSGGKEATVYHTVRLAVLGIAEAMVKAKEIDRTFTPGELRMTVETRLQAAGVDKEVRAHLQSHGISGVQDKHYGRYGFMDEKRAELERLRAMLEPEDNILPMRRKKSGTRR